MLDEVLVQQALDGAEVSSHDGIVEIQKHLELVARALRLDSAERAHLFILAHDRPPPLTDFVASWVTPAHRRLLESPAGPAYLATPRWDVVAWNSVLTAVFGDVEKIPVERRNMLWLAFADPDHRAAMKNWENDARAMVAKFRVEFGQRRRDRGFRSLIADLKAASHAFHRWWDEQDVTRRPDATKRFQSDKFGTMEFEQTTFLTDDALDLRLTVYTPLDAKTDRIVRRLKSASKLRTRSGR
jgi:hypothetical protein